MVLSFVLVAAQLASVNARAADGFDDSLKDLRDSLGGSARAVGARFPVSPHPRPLPQAGEGARQSRHGGVSGNPCLADKALDALKLRWTFEPDPPAFYVKLAAIQADFASGSCEPYFPPPEAHHGDTPQAIRRYAGSRDYDLVLVTDAGSADTGVVLVTKAGMVAVSYGEFPTESLLKGAALLPKLPVAKSLTESMKGKSTLALLPK